MNQTHRTRRSGTASRRRLLRTIGAAAVAPLLAPVAGVFAAQQIKPQARTLAEDRGIRCVTLNYDSMRGMDSDEFRLF